MDIKALLSTPKIKDEFFYKSIILIIKEYENSHMGLILNKPIDETIKKFWETDYSDQKIKVGGPVPASVMLLHKSKKYSDYEIIPSKVYLSVHVNNVEKVLKTTKSKYEMYVGYCAWMQGQLIEEIYNGSWWSIKPNENMIFDNEENLWDIYKYKQDLAYLEKLNIKNQNYKSN
jgi:putative transcriptional regulator